MEVWSVTAFLCKPENCWVSDSWILSMNIKIICFYPRNFWSPILAYFNINSQVAVHLCKEAAVNSFSGYQSELQKKSLLQKADFIFFGKWVFKVLREDSSRFVGQNEHKAAAEIMMRGGFQMYSPGAYSLKKDKNVRWTVAVLAGEQFLLSGKQWVFQKTVGPLWHNISLKRQIQEADWPTTLHPLTTFTYLMAFRGIHLCIFK